MPIISNEELKRIVVEGRVGAISIDTSTVEQNQYGFESGVLAKMSQFSRMDVHHLVLDIVLHEMRSHLKGQADLDKAQIKNALKPLGNSWGINKDDRQEALEVLFNGQTGEEKTEERLSDFIKNTSATVLSCSDFVSLPDILSRYMEIKAPFGNTEAKKREFPDAFALLALEGWAVKNNKKVVAVSKDGDWKRYCTDSEAIYLVDNLTHALSVFQGGADEAAELFSEKLSSGEIQELDDLIIDEINTQSDKIEVDFEATAHCYYDAELIEVSVSAGEPLAGQLSDFEVIEYENNTLVIQSSITLNVNAQFNVMFDQWDSIDREYVGAGSTTVENTEEIDLDLLLTLIFDDGKISIDSVELLRKRTSMDFGEIEPNWMDDYSSDDDGEDS